MSGLVSQTQSRYVAIHKQVIEMQPTAPYLLPLFNHFRQVQIFSTTLPAQTLKLVTVREAIPARLNTIQKPRNQWASDTNDSMNPLLYRVWWNSRENDLK